MLSSNGDTFKWTCEENSTNTHSGAFGGYRVTKSVSGVSEIFQGKLEAFNITLNYNGDEVINPVAVDEDLSFIYCPGLGSQKKGAFYEKSCSSGSRYIDVTKETIQADLAEGNIDSTYDDVAHEYPLKDSSGNLLFNVVVAGAVSKS